MYSFIKQNGLVAVSVLNKFGTKVHLFYGICKYIVQKIRFLSQISKKIPQS